MPFTSKAQRAWMHANAPKMARRWEKETPNYVLKRLPNRLKKKKFSIQGSWGQKIQLKDLKKI